MLWVHISSRGTWRDFKFNKTLVVNLFCYLRVKNSRKQMFLFWEKVHHKYIQSAGVTPEVNLRITQARKHTGDSLALKPRADITRSPKQGYQWPHEKDLSLPKILLKKGTSQMRYWSLLRMEPISKGKLIFQINLPICSLGKSLAHHIRWTIIILTLTTEDRDHGGSENSDQNCNQYVRLSVLWFELTSS